MGVGNQDSIACARRETHFLAGTSYAYDSCVPEGLGVPASSQASRIAAIMLVRTSDALSGDLEGRSVIRTRPRKWQSQRDVYSLIEGVEFERDQALVVIHAENAIKLTRRTR